MANDDVHFTVRLPPEPDSVPRARRVVEEAGPTLDPQTLLNLRLLVSELVTNAVRHVPAGEEADIVLTVARDEDRVRVEVVDEGPGFVPGPRDTTSERASGWGLNIVAEVATRWGVENDEGARVWFEIETPEQRERAPL